jgi:hypothetical protein
MRTTRAWIVAGGAAALIGVVVLGALGVAAWQAGHARMATALAGAGATAVIILGGCTIIGAIVVRAVAHCCGTYRDGVATTVDRLAQALRAIGDE